MLAATVTAGFVLVGCGSTQAAAPVTSVAPVTVTVVASATTTAPVEPATFTLTGTLTRKFSQGAGTACNPGTDGFGDIRMGAAVTVYDESSKVLAVGELGRGSFVAIPKATYANGGGEVGTCTYPLSVPGVPAATMYQVEIAHRGKVVVSPEDAKAGAFAAELGGS